MLGKRIRKLRESKEISQKQLADMLSVGPSTISMWEQGRRNPDNEMLLKISQLFDCSIDFLLGRSNTKQTDKNEFHEQNEKFVDDLIEEYKKKNIDLDSLPFDEKQKLIKQIVAFTIAVKND